MSRTPRSRVAVLLAAALVGISNSGIAAAHGHAHHEAHERAMAHEVAAGAEANAPEGEHAHPALALGASARTDAHGALMVPADATSFPAAVSEFVEAPSAAAPVTSRAAARASPRQPRAPPSA